MCDYSFEVLGDPVGKMRPKVTRYTVFTPKKTVDYENAIRNAFKEKYGVIPSEDPVKVEVISYLPIAKSISKKKHEFLLRNEYAMKKPDIDNIVKSVLDALNGIAYDDDKRVVSLCTTKKYSDNPRIEVEITKLPYEEYC